MCGPPHPCWFTNARITSFFFEALRFRRPMWSLRTKLVYNWWSPEQPVTTGIALARSLRSPGYPDSDTMRCVSWRLCDTRVLCRHGPQRPPPPFFLNWSPFFLFFFLQPPQFHIWPSVNDLAACTQPLLSEWRRACSRLAHADPLRDRRAAAK